jgi:hypothetical protein
MAGAGNPSAKLPAQVGSAAVRGPSTDGSPAKESQKKLAKRRHLQQIAAGGRASLDHARVGDYLAMDETDHVVPRFPKAANSAGQ